MVHKVLFIVIVLCISCRTSRTVSTNFSPKAMINTATETDVLDSILRSDTDKFRMYLQNKDSLHLQIIYTRIDRDANNKPTFTDYTFNLNEEAYFYPASTVKMPISFLALEKLNELINNGIDKYSTMITDSSNLKQEVVFNHPTAYEGKPTIAQYIKEIFLVSDNDAFNRLYEFLGQEYINKKLKEKGYNNVEILHRLSVPLTEEQNRHTNPVSFYDTAGNLLYHQPAGYNSTTYSVRNNKAGKGFYSGGSLKNEPFDFSRKNRISLSDLHSVLRSVIFPEVLSPQNRFNLTENDYSFLYKYMSAWPRESKFPSYDTSTHHDAYVKFLLLGSEKGQQHGNIRIFNKVGFAYGFLTDVAYIVDLENKIEFMLSATLLCNSDGIFNDNKYDYETTGYPFMKNLGNAVHQYEKQRQRQHAPNLSRFVIDYSKD